MRPFRQNSLLILLAIVLIGCGPAAPVAQQQAVLSETPTVPLPTVPQPPVPQPPVPQPPVPLPTATPAQEAATAVAVLPTATVAPATVALPTATTPPDWLQTATVEGDFFVLGNPAAPVRLIDYSDFF